MKKKLAIGITGASGAIYASTLIHRLQGLSDQLEEVGIVMTDNAKDVWEHELGNKNFKTFLILI